MHNNNMLFEKFKKDLLQPNSSNIFLYLYKYRAGVMHCFHRSRTMKSWWYSADEVKVRREVKTHNCVKVIMSHRMISLTSSHVVFFPAFRSPTDTVCNHKPRWSPVTHQFCFDLSESWLALGDFMGSYWSRAEKLLEFKPCLYNNVTLCWASSFTILK